MHGFIRGLFIPIKTLSIALTICIIGAMSWFGQPVIALGGESSSGSSIITSRDALLVADPEGQIIYKKNETLKCIPASTLKILTALAAIHHLGKSYRFKTEIYQDTDKNLKIKGYGDPLLVSEVWREIAVALATRLRDFNNLVLDDSYFAPHIQIPGVGQSTNPYDALNGALCANFNTVFFRRDKKSSIISAESQTPMVPIVLEKIKALGLKSGRHSLFRNQRDLARYAGELLVYFLEDRGVNFHGNIRMGVVKQADRLIYTYRSAFTLEQTLKKMLEFSNNFVANQIFITLGAHVHGPPGTLEKGISVVSKYSLEDLHLSDIKISEGSGVSRKNRLSALDMLAILKRFKRYRAMLTRDGPIQYKSGHLENVKAKAGYIEYNSGPPYYFVIFLNHPHPDIESVMNFVENLKSVN